MTALRIIGGGGHGKVVAETALACGYDDIAFLDQRWPEQTRTGRWPVVGVPAQGPVLAHPSAILSPSATIGAGTLIVAGSILNADARLGMGVILNTGASVDHDCEIGDFAHISPGARLAGGVRIGARSWIGIGAVVREGVTIGADVMVGAGAAVICDIADGTQVAGVPAKPFI